MLEDYPGEYLQNDLGKQMESGFWNRNIFRFPDQSYSSGFWNRNIFHFPDQSYSNRTKIERKWKSIDQVQNGS